MREGERKREKIILFQLTVNIGINNHSNWIRNGTDFQLFLSSFFSLICISFSSPFPLFSPIFLIFYLDFHLEDSLFFLNFTHFGNGSNWKEWIEEKVKSKESNLKSFNWRLGLQFFEEPGSRGRRKVRQKGKGREKENMR